MVLNCFRHNDYKISRLRTIVFTIITYVFGVTGALIMGKIYTAICVIHNVDDNSRVAIFGAVIFTPLMLTATAAVDKLISGYRLQIYHNKKHVKHNKLPEVSIRNTIDLLTPGIFIILTCAKLGCFFEGCCYGVECSWGVYSDRAGTTVFPVQLFEVGTMLIVLLLSFIIKRTGFYRRGMAYPLTAALYCIARFGWEFMRYYPAQMQHVLFGLTFWQFLCVIVFVTSVISIAVLYKTQPSNPLTFDKN